jgi:hypothetical protein
MAGINFKDGPGGRMKRAQQAQVLYVKSAKDPRLKAFQDSTSLYNQFKDSKSKYVDFVNAQGLDPNYIAEWKTNGYVDKDIHPKIGAVSYGILKNSGGGFSRDAKGNPIDFTIYPDKSGNDMSLYSNTKIGKTIGTRYPIYKKPERTVLYDPRPEQPVIERMAPRQAMPPEIVAPAMRPMPMPVPVEQVAPLMEEAPVVAQEAAPIVPQKLKGVAATKHISPSRGGGWSNQPLLMRMFPKLYAR